MRVDLLNYPISGSHWLAYCITQLTGAQFIGIGPSGTYPGVGELGYIGKTHGQSVGWWESFNLETDALIVLVRNYKECMVRQRKLTFEDLKADCQGARGINVDYIAILQLYDKMPDNRRILVYYEDLMVDCVLEVNRVIEFLRTFGVSSQPIQVLEDNFEWHKENSRKLYDRGFQHTPCETRGETVFHSNKLSDSVKRQIDSYLREIYPELFNKYLVKYIENPDRL